MVVRSAAGLEKATMVPFAGALITIVKKIQAHAEAVGENDASVTEAGRRALAIHEVVERVMGAEFPSDNRGDEADNRPPLQLFQRFQ